MAVVTARTPSAERTLVDRLLAAVPLLSIFLWLTIVYMIQAWAHKTPWIGGARFAARLAPLLRGVLLVVLAVFLLAGIFLLWRDGYGSRWRGSWSAWDWVGFVTLVVGAGVIVSAVLGHRSLQWNYTTRL